MTPGTTSQGAAQTAAPSAMLPAAAPDRALVHCVGISIHSAPAEVRERLVCDATTIGALLARFGCGDARPAGLGELVVLSTCSRLELYATGGASSAEGLTELLDELTNGAATTHGNAVYTLAGIDAIRHLCRVAAGLESLAIGEPQVLGQVSDALARARTNGSAGPVMSAVFRSATRAGRRARAETGIGRHPITVSSVAINRVAAAVELGRASALVVGAGEMGELAAAALYYRGVGDLTVVSRTHERAERLAARLSARTGTFGQLVDLIADADIVVTSTAAPHHVITADIVGAAMARRPTRPLLVVDIAFPRDVDPAIADLDGVRLFDLDRLRQDAAENSDARAGEIPDVEAIVEVETAACAEWMHQVEVAPLIADLRTRADLIRRRTVQKAMRQFAHLSPADRERIEALSEAIVNRVLHEPTARLRLDAASGRGAESALALRRLFGLEH